MHSSHHREPRPTFSLAVPSPSAASSRPSRRYYALAPARQRQITLHFQSPKELQRPTPPSEPLLPPASLAHHHHPRSSSTSFHGTRLLCRPTILTPLSSPLPRPPPTTPDHPRPVALLPPVGLRDSPLCRASNGCSTPTHSVRTSCPRTTSRPLAILRRPPRATPRVPSAPPPSNVHAGYG